MGLWTALDSCISDLSQTGGFSVTTDHRVVTKYQNDSKAEFTGSPSETESDSDSAGEIEGEDKISASSVIYSSKSS